MDSSTHEIATEGYCGNCHKWWLGGARCPNCFGLPRLQKQDVPIDQVNHPPHYTQHPSGVECIAVTEHMNFCLGNAMKYIWRASEKGDTVTDLEKAIWYLQREVARLRATAGSASAPTGGVSRS